jgi:hypothetical protein
MIKCEGRKVIGTLISELLEAVEASDVAETSKRVKEKMREGVDPWEIHLSLFPVVQRVLSPPFINPHLPKMYRICREFLPYLKKDEIRALIQLEVNEYARRPKLDELPKANPLTLPVSFKDIESAIRSRDQEKAAVLMATFYSQKRGAELGRRLLLLGSGYLDNSLGHSISCTSFIFLEMMEREDQDPWPAMAALADYFCKGGFHTTPALRKLTLLPPDEAIKHHLLRATSGLGIANLHHTITIYALERVCHLFSREEYDHMVDAWIAFIGNKKAEQVAMDRPEAKPPADYNRFYEIFSTLEPNAVLASIRRMLVSQEGRHQLGHFLIKGLCDQYQGNYNPHYLTGLGSALWVVGRFWNQGSLAINALSQHLNFFFDGIKS